MHQNEITLLKPDDWHVHVRDGDVLKHTVPHTARQFGRAVIMPNLTPPITTVAQALDYRKRILGTLPCDTNFNPLMSLYLTDNTPVDEVLRAAENPHIIGFKLYPAGATTNSDAGVTDMKNVYPVLEEMEKHGVVLQVHGEVTRPEVDIFDREKMFIDQILTPLLRTDFPNLRIVFEHVTTQEGVEFVRSWGSNVAATITAHHLLINRNSILVGGIHPHNYCLPVAKRESHRQSLLKAAFSPCSGGYLSDNTGNQKFFLGTDSAPHAQSGKESSCGCAGCFTAPHALELYATVFEEYGAMNGMKDWPIKLEQFASINGARFYGLPLNEKTITLERKESVIPEKYPFKEHPGYPFRKYKRHVVASTPRHEDCIVIPFFAGKTLPWKIPAEQK